MPETYKLTATPSLFPKGEFEGELKGVTFTATSPSNIRRWFTINCGQFEDSFSKLVPAKLVDEMIVTLIHGDNIDFPGRYQDDQFDGGFAYVHNGRPVALNSSRSDR
jgi:hypothetical protein